MGPRGLSQFWNDPTGWVTPEPRLEESSGRGEPSGRVAPRPRPPPLASSIQLCRILQKQIWPRQWRGEDGDRGQA